MAATPDPTGTVEKMCVDNETLSDWTIVSEEGQRFPCHRVILAAKSPALMAMMTTEMKEKEAKETKVHYNNQVVEAFVDYFYKGEVPTGILKANIASFMDLAELYNLGPMKAQVEDVAIKSLSEDQDIANVVEMFSLANQYNAETLLEATKVVIVENKKILGQQDLSQIPQSIMAELFKIVSQV